jgi:ribosomal protein S8
MLKLTLPSLIKVILSSSSHMFSFYQVLELEGVIEGIERTASDDQQMEVELARVVKEVNRLKSRTDILQKRLRDPHLSCFQCSHWSD